MKILLCAIFGVMCGSATFTGWRINPDRVGTWREAVYISGCMAVLMTMGAYAVSGNR